jgi:hypothetical protein
MGTFNLLSEFLVGQPLFAEISQDLMFLASYRLLLLGFAK